MAYRLYPAAVILTSENKRSRDCVAGFVLKLPEKTQLSKDLAESIFDRIREEFSAEQGAEVLSGRTWSLRVEFEVHGRIHFVGLHPKYGLIVGRRFNTLPQDHRRLGGARVLEVFEYAT